MSPALCPGCDRASCRCAPPKTEQRRWCVRVYPDRMPALVRRDMTVTFTVRADDGDEARHIGQEHRPDLKGWIWELEEIK